MAGSAFIGSLHESGPSACYDVAPHLRQSRSDKLRRFITKAARLDARGSEDRHTITIVARRAQPGQLVNHVPEPQDGFDEYLFDALFIGKTDNIGLTFL